MSKVWEKRLSEVKEHMSYEEKDIINTTETAVGMIGCSVIILSILDIILSFMTFLWFNKFTLFVTGTFVFLTFILYLITFFGSRRLKKKMQEIKNKYEG